MISQSIRTKKKTQILLRSILITRFSDGSKSKRNQKIQIAFLLCLGRSIEIEISRRETKKKMCARVSIVDEL
jgi:hypothetical protein